VTCFFLLDEVPEDMKTRIVQALLGVVRPGGKVVFVDYHRPHPAHPLRLVMQFVFAWLEPFRLDVVDMFDSRLCAVTDDTIPLAQRDIVWWTLPGRGGHAAPGVSLILVVEELKARAARERRLPGVNETQSVNAAEMKLLAPWPAE